MLVLETLVIFLQFFINHVIGHGMVLDPLNRGSIWRGGYPVEPNYNDNANFCGGYMVQWQLNDGKCGVCGDDYRAPQPRANENTGQYGRGFVTKIYNHSSIISTTVLITANHNGYFKFSLCELTDPDTYEKEECFVDLKLDNGDENVYTLPSTDVGNYTVQVKLPEGFTCDRCVFRWEYIAANSWGECGDGTAKVGCGPQETFRTCSDISIV